MKKDTTTKAELIGKPTNIQVYETIEYDKFAFLTGNRALAPYHVEELIKSIKKVNFLPQTPIIINKNGEIIDGQHRLLAAKKLELPIYYIIHENATLVDAVLLNTSLKNWNNTDYFNSYVSMKYPEYMTLRNFMDKYTLTLGMSIILLTQNYIHTNSIYRYFKMGKFVVGDLAIAEDMASLIKELQYYCSSWHRREFLVALHNYREKTNPHMLASQLEKYNLVITERSTWEEYLAQFEEIAKIKTKGDITNIV